MAGGQGGGAVRPGWLGVSLRGWESGKPQITWPASQLGNPQILISSLLLTPNFSWEGCFPGRISNFYGNFYRNHREKRPWLVPMSWERRGVGNSLECWAVHNRTTGR